MIQRISTNFSINELNSELKSFNIHLQLINTICLIILAHDDHAKLIYDFTSLFYLCVFTFKTFKNSSPTQCFSCQRFEHSFSNCIYKPHYVKYSGRQLAKSCPKTTKQIPACCNCGSDHMANYHGCPYYKHVVTLSPLLYNQQLCNLLCH